MPNPRPYASLRYADRDPDFDRRIAERGKHKKEMTELNRSLGLTPGKRKRNGEKAGLTNRLKSVKVTLPSIPHHGDHHD